MKKRSFMSRKAFKSPLFVVLAAVVVGVTLLGGGSASVQEVLGQGKSSGGEVIDGGAGSGSGSGFGNVDYCPVQTDPQGNPYPLCGQGNSCPSGSSCVVLGTTGQGGNTVQCSYCVPQEDQLPCEITDTCPPGDDDPDPPAQQFNFSLSNNGPLNFGYSTSGTQTSNATIEIDLESNPAQPVNLSITNPPGTNPSGVGITASISGSQTCTPNCSKTLVVNVPARMPAGTYAVTVEGSHGNLERTTNVMVNVNPVAIPVDCDFDPAPEAQPLCGFAWSGTNDGDDTGVGWISFNSDDISGATQSYKVTMSADGTLRGCAWSPNVGWIKFGGTEPLSGNPTPVSNDQVTAKLSTNSNAVTQTNVSLQGWARACAGTVNSSNPNLPGNCSSMTPRLDWDGWISLKNAVAGASVMFNNGAFSGFSWGGDVLGWINWDAGPNPSDAVRFCSVQIPDFILNNVNVSIPRGETGTANVVAARLNTSTPFPAGITLAIGTLPSGIADASFANNVCGSTSPCSRPMSITVAGSAVEDQTYVIPITATVTTPQGEMTRSANVNVTVGGSDNPGGDLVLTCTPPPPETIFVNRPVAVSVGVTGSTTPNFYYSTDGSEPTSPSGGVASIETVSRTFTTVGRKTFTIRVKDSSEPAAEGSCDVTVDVKVAPSIIEI